ncbi:VOC family protein [Streptomyces sp. NBC_00448]|uniref:VOC family protein n=1 Tax=Streptomyces sp. NBC_00448 TaxID=2903652 RepID=UPI002E1B37C5
MPATVELAAITVDCQDPGPIAAFYQAATGGESVRSGADSARVKIAGILWIFRRVEDYRPPTWPSARVPLQMHLEFSVDDLTAAEEELIGLGATTAEYPSDRAAGLLVMLDPAGHPFCISDAFAEAAGLRGRPADRLTGRRRTLRVTRRRFRAHRQRGGGFRSGLAGCGRRLRGTGDGNLGSCPGCRWRVSTTSWSMTTT